mmetsp:Transcript_17671/g.41739  ORF Transcript_17671/g.41739 Transcript_17671/m.41739 type:complete len:216 (+) Transcript_17671:215-862(+)
MPTMMQLFLFRCRPGYHRLWRPLRHRGWHDKWSSGRMNSRLRYKQRSSCGTRRKKRRGRNDRRYQSTPRPDEPPGRKVETQQKTYRNTTKHANTCRTCISLISCTGDSRRKVEQPSRQTCCPETMTINRPQSGRPSSTPFITMLRPVPSSTVRSTAVLLAITAAAVCSIFSRQSMECQHRPPESSLRITPMCCSPKPKPGLSMRLYCTELATTIV